MNTRIKIAIEIGEFKNPPTSDSQKPQSLWGDMPIHKQRSPAKILNEQAMLLEELTNNRLCAWIDKGSFIIGVIDRKLKDRRTILTFHPLESRSLYPIVLSTLSSQRPSSFYPDGGTITVRDEETFITVIKEYLQSTTVKTIIENLLALVV